MSGFVVGDDGADYFAQVATDAARVRMVGRPLDEVVAAAVDIESKLHELVATAVLREVDAVAVQLSLIDGAHVVL